jgi:superoxide dismutase, Fe-Mn family
MHSLCPNFPTSHDALQPYMSRETLEYHHDEYRLDYVNSANDLLKGSEWEGKLLGEVVRCTFGVNCALFNNASEHYNHSHFWKWMRPQGGSDKIPGSRSRSSRILGRRRK